MTKRARPHCRDRVSVIRSGLHVMTVDPLSMAERLMTLARGDPALDIRVLRGCEMSTEATLFDEVARIYEFPAYFGGMGTGNWDELADYITDLSWLAPRRHLFVVRDAEQVLTTAPDRFGTFVTVLDDAIQDWATQAGAAQAAPGDFEVVFQVASNSALRSVTDKLTAAQVSYDLWN